MLWLTDSIAKFLGFKSTKHFKDLHLLLEGGISIYNKATDNSDYFNYQKYALIKDRFDFLTSYTSGFKGAVFIWYGNFIGLNTTNVVKEFGSIYNNLLLNKNDYNESYVNHSLEKYKEYFDTHFKNPLTEEQRRAIIVDEDNNYINAGAGCGKTQTIISKIVFLVKKKGIDPTSILVLAFNKNAQIELENRLLIFKIEGVIIKTFHSFGLNIFTKSSASRKEIIFADRNESRSKFIQKKIDDIFLNENMTQTADFINYFAYLLDEPKQKSAEEIKKLTLKQYTSFLKEGDMRSLNGVYLKSKQEVMIANFLYLNSIEFEYEKKYPHQESSSLRNVYKPDFYLPEYDIWLEHFALNKNSEGLLESHFDGYKDDYEWKIKRHEECNTKLMSTFSYQFLDGEKKFVKNLKILLAENGIKTKVRDKKEVVENIKRYKGPTVTKFAQLFETFLSLAKSSEKNPHKLYKKQVGEERERNKKFLDLFIPVYDSYQKKLGNKYIDFDDMIGLSTKALEEKEIEKNKFNYIMIDEFQDIGLGRFNLINSLKQTNPESKLLCVGDDWQAIYRFTGGDVNILFEFEKYFGSNSKELRLTKSFRLSNQLAQISNKFIRKNEKQSNKEIHSSKQIDTAIHIFCFNDEKNYKERLKIFEQIFKKIYELSDSKKSTVLILNRYNYDNLKAMYNKILAVFRKKYPTLKIHSSTIHKQKGAEYDFVILDDLIGDFIGFPNKMGEDSVLHMVMEKPEDFIDAEERRVFYVGITRSKMATFIIANRLKRSVFFDEIKDDRGVKIYDESIACNKCGDGVMVLKINRKTKENFYSCSEYPDCYNTFKEKGNSKKGFQNPKKSYSNNKGYAVGDKVENKGYAVGDKVEHALFGVGFILIVSGSGEHQKIGVEFDGGLRKKFIVKYVKLKKL